MKARILAALLCALVLTGLISSTALARSRTILYDSGPKKGQSTGITLITPDTHSSYVDAPITEKVVSTGVGDRALRGKVTVEYILDSGRQVIPNGVYVISQTGDLDLTLTYPAVSLWPPMSNGTREIHITIQIELFEGGVKVATLGPGNDWDVFNRYPPPPANCTQGCTPAYWAQHLSALPTGLTANTSFKTAFGAGPDIPLSQALTATGTPDAKLLREASAALLNVYSRSSTFQYALNAQTVVYLTRFAYLDNKFDVADTFAFENARNCPLK
jgi:hypothetical protein